MLVECLLWLETLNQPKMFKVGAGKELCLLSKNYLKMFCLLKDHRIGPDSVLAWLIPFLELKFSSNVQHKTQCMLNIKGCYWRNAPGPLEG